jgi:hypothetical protein
MGVVAREPRANAALLRLPESVHSSDRPGSSRRCLATDPATRAADVAAAPPI